MQEVEQTEPKEEKPPEGFPEGVFIRDGQLYRNKTIGSVDGSSRVQVRPVARTLEEAKAKRWDYYHSEELGWVLQGYKWEKDRSTESIMTDTSQGVPLSVQEQEKRKQEAMNNG